MPHVGRRRVAASRVWFCPFLSIAPHSVLFKSGMRIVFVSKCGETAHCYMVPSSLVVHHCRSRPKCRTSPGLCTRMECNSEVIHVVKIASCLKREVVLTPTTKSRALDPSYLQCKCKCYTGWHSPEQSQGASGLDKSLDQLEPPSQRYRRGSPPPSSRMILSMK